MFGPKAAQTPSFHTAALVVARNKAIVKERLRNGEKRSKYTGVTALSNGRWSAAIKCQGNRYRRLGQFDEEEDAAKAWDQAARGYREAAAHGANPGHGSQVGSYCHFILSSNPWQMLFANIHTFVLYGF